jgi:hypothetical protein
VRVMCQHSQAMSRIGYLNQRGDLRVPGAHDLPGRALAVCV